MRRPLLSLAATLALLSAWMAQPALAQQSSGILVGHFDLDSATFISCRTSGSSGLIPQPVPLPAAVTAAGTTTFNATTPGTAPFLGLLPGDVLTLPPTGAGLRPDIRVILTKPSDDQVTVDTAATFTAGQLGRYFQRGCGTGDDAGWFRISKLRNVALTFQVRQQNTATGVDVIVQCRSGAAGALPTQVFPDNSGGPAVRTYTGATADTRTRFAVTDGAGCAEVRVAMKLNTADDGAGDAGANMELLDVTIEGEPK